MSSKVPRGPQSGDYQATAGRLAKKAKNSTNNSGNEATLRHELESALEEAVNELKANWSSLGFDYPLLRGSKKVDAVHGAVVIEYEPPKSFKGKVGSKLEHARKQAQDYAKPLSEHEGRDLGEYRLVAWDGESISFGRFIGGEPKWGPVEPFGDSQAELLLQAVRATNRMRLRETGSI